MAFVYLPLVTVDDLSRTASDHQPRPLSPPPALPLTSHHRCAWQRPQAIPLIPADLQTGRQQL